MNSLTVFVGLDYHQDSVQVCVMDGGGKVLSKRTWQEEGGAIRAPGRVRGWLGAARVLRPEARAWTKVWRRWVRPVKLGEHARWVLDQHLKRLTELAADIQAVEERIAMTTADDAVVQRLLKHKGV